MKRVLVIFLMGVLSVNLKAKEGKPLLFDNFWNDTRDSFTGSNLYFHGAAMAATALLVRSGSDARVRDTFKNSRNEAAIPGAVIGSGAGALVAFMSLYSQDDHEEVGAALAIAQSSAITLGYVLTLKVTTGRAHPTNSWGLSSQEQSEQFQFGLFRNGLTSYGWPSGHVSHTAAVTSTLAYYYPEKTWLKWLGGGLTSYMLYTVVAYDSGQMHWFSDGIAGGLMGYTIGSTIGKNARHRLDGTKEKPSQVSWFPIAGPNFIGSTISIVL